MSTFLVEDLEKHIDNLRAQLQFFNGALEATDHTAPDWLATDLVSLRNKTGRLQDEMQKFRTQLETEGYKTRKDSNKRLSLEGAKPERASKSPKLSHTSIPSHAHPRQPPQQFSVPRQQSSVSPPQPEPSYVAQHIDVTEEVNRRLQESRLRRLMDSPKTSQKRKRDAYGDTGLSNGQTPEDGEDDEGPATPTKRLKASGSFEPKLKRKGGSKLKNADGRNSERADFKRRRLWSGMT